MGKNWKLFRNFGTWEGYKNDDNVKAYVTSNTRQEKCVGRVQRALVNMKMSVVNKSNTLVFKARRCKIILDKMNKLHRRASI